MLVRHKNKGLIPCFGFVGLVFLLLATTCSHREPLKSQIAPLPQEPIAPKEAHIKPPAEAVRKLQTVDRNSCPFSTVAKKIGESIATLGIEVGREFFGPANDTCENSSMLSSDRIDRILLAKTGELQSQFQSIFKAYQQIQSENENLATYIYAAIQSKISGTFGGGTLGDLTGLPFHVIVDQLRHNIGVIKSSKTAIDEYLEYLTSDNFEQTTQVCTIVGTTTFNLACDALECVFGEGSASGVREVGTVYIRKAISAIGEVVSTGAQFVIDCQLTETVAESLQSSLSSAISSLTAAELVIRTASNLALYELSKAIALVGQLDSEIQRGCINMGGMYAYIESQLPSARRTFLEWMIRATGLFNHCEVDHMIKFALSTPGLKENAQERMTPFACTFACMTNAINQWPMSVPYPPLTGGYVSLGYSGALAAVSGGHSWDVFVFWAFTIVYIDKNIPAVSP